MEIDQNSESAPLGPRERIIERLVVLGVPKEYCCRRYSGLVEFVRAHPSRIPEVVSAILPTDEEVAEALQEAKRRSRRFPANPSMKKQFRESMVWLQWLMFEKEPISTLRKLAKLSCGQRGVCGAFWGANDIAYRCRTCENDPTCAICVSCFQNGNHEDHDYSIIYTGGGCCDCGDETAWKREGFCSKHKGAEKMQPLQEKLANSVGPVLDALFVCWRSKLLSADNVSQIEFRSSDIIELEKWANEMTFAVVEMLLEFCKYSESLLSFVSARIISSANLLSILVRAESYLSRDVVKKLQQLLLKLLGEPIFKSEFAKVFVDYYPIVISEVIKQGTDDAFDKFPLLSAFSVQIFTVPTLIPHLLKEMNLFGVLLGCLGGIFIACVGEDGRLQGMKWERLGETTNQVIEDIKLVMSQSAASRYATHDKNDISKIWLRLLAFVHGINPLKRETGIHVEEENWFTHAFFVLDHSVADIHSLLIDSMYSTGVSRELIDDKLTSKGEVYKEDRSGERHANLGSVSDKSYVCSETGSGTSVGISKADQITTSDFLCALIPSSAICLIRDCLNVLETCLIADEGISRVLDNVSSTNLGSSADSNILGLERALSNIVKENHAYQILGNSNDFSMGIPPVSSNTEMSINLEDAGDSNGEIIAGENDRVSNSTLALLESSSEGDFIVKSDTLHALSQSDWPDIDYDVSSQDISVHIPLHRLLSLLLQKALKRCYEEYSLSPSICSRLESPYTDFFRYTLGNCCSYGFSAVVMEHVLRVRVFCAQVSAGLWRRNGDAALAICEWSEQGLELDLFLLQCCGALGPADSFISRIFDRFGLSSYLSLSLERHSEFEPALVHEMLILIIQILQERRFCGLSTADSLRREIIYKLAAGDVTRSQLVKSLPRDVSEFANLQEILDSVAVYSHPSGFNQGKYSLRSSCWRELDLYHPHWNSKDLQAAEERYARHHGISASTAQVPKWTNIHPPLEGLAKIATCRATFKIIYAVLYYALHMDKSNESRATDGVLICALHLLSLSLDICIQKRESNRQQSYIEDLTPILAVAGPEDEEINQAVVKQSLLSLLVSLMRTRQESSLHRFTETGSSDLSVWIGSLLRKFAEIDSACMSELQRLSPELVGQSSVPDTVIPNFAFDSEKRKAKARARQAAILAKMKAAQSNFLASTDSGVDNYGTKAESDMSKFDVQHDSQVLINEACSLCHESDPKEPLSFLIFLQKSKILSFVDRGPPSWDQTGQSQNKVSDKAPDHMDINVSNSSRSGSPPLVPIMALDKSSKFWQQKGGISVSELLKAYLTRNHVQTKSISGRVDGGHTIELLEQGMYLAIREKIDDMKCKSFTLVKDEMIDGESGTSCSLIGDQPDLVDKYAEIFSREKGHPSASTNLSSRKTVGESVLQAPYDGLRPIDCDGIHLSSCGHAVHQGCLNRYLSSLKERSVGRNFFEGAFIVDPYKGEFLCPVCRRLANSVLPTAPGGSENTWMLPMDSEIMSTAFASEDKSNEQTSSLRLSESFHLLQSAADMIENADISKAIPFQKNDQKRKDLESVSGTLSKLYFSKSRHNILQDQETRWVDQSIIMWDTLKYSLISMEVAARCGKTSMPPIYGIDALCEELKTSNGSILLLLLRITQNIKTKNAAHALQRFGGLQLFAESICFGNSVSYPSCIHGRAEASFNDSRLWKLASDPVLARDPFSSLMWVLFCLPFPCMSCKESLLSLVHIFYALSLVQVVIMYSAQHQNDFREFGSRDCLFTDISKVLGESGCLQQYFVSNCLESSRNVKDTLRRFCFPFLRRCALLWRLLDASSGSSIAKIDFMDADLTELHEVEKMEKMFKIPPIDAIMDDKYVRSFALNWIQHFRREYEGNRTKGFLYVTPSTPFRLMNLPHLYQNLLQRCVKQCCPDCRRVNEAPAICLLCGKLCSSIRMACCRESGSLNHSISCGAGIGVFLLIRRTTILLQRCGRQASWPSLYLDAFGEEDIDMQRGKPLYLNEERYAALTYMVASHGLDQSSKVLAHTTFGSLPGVED